ncbi:intracellular coagulation inhibitor 3-like [Mytilus californianus]|uniref:intracellular coagulation inhibitor 3-like n=1 Tax=Mytilus californianus TaxID=6549 RepID=UPI002246BFCA|nr:intracellular coagulation inhibitor 3-like [Mytilus californianus]
MLGDIPPDFQQSLIKFSASLYKGFNKTESVCMSPYSITAAFLLLMIGASGRSKQQLSSAIFQNSSFSDEEKLKYYKSLHNNIIERAGINVDLASANSLFVSDQFTVLQNVRENARRYFGADISIKDFTKPKTSASEMNRWVLKQTNGKIKDLIKEEWFDTNTIMFIINAIYFKATWLMPFSPSSTRKQNFYLPNNKKIKVDMMQKELVFPLFFRGLHFSAIALPFRGRVFDMVFILPDATDGLPNIEEKITPEFLNDISAGFKQSVLKIAIPKFKLQSEFDLTKELPKLGVKDIFGYKANFSNLIIERTQGLHVKVAVHKTVFNMNEAGIEGAAVTATRFGLRMSIPSGFTANRPFLFYVRDIKSGLILFIGRFHPQLK